MFPPRAPGLRVTEPHFRARHGKDTLMPTAEEIAAAAATEAEAKRNKEIETVIHSAVATHLKTALPKALEGFKSQITEALAPMMGDALKTQFAEYAKTVTPQTDPNKSDPAKSPELLAVKARLEDMEKTAKANEQRALASEKQRRDDAAMTSVRTAFGSKGIRPELLDALTTSEWAKGRFKFDEKGAVLMTVRRAQMAGLEARDEDLPLTDAVDHWSRSKEAEAFLPPPKTAQSQQQQRAAGRAAPPRGPTYEGPAKTEGEKTRRSMEREAGLAEQFPHLAR